MAKATIKLPTAFIDALQAADTELDEVSEQTLNAGAAVVEPRMRANLSTAIGRNTKSPSRSTGQLLNALGVTSVKTDSNGNHNIKVGFAPSRSDGRSNALIATVLEYGRSNQVARPFLAPTRSQTRTATIAAMKQTMAAQLQRFAP